MADDQHVSPGDAPTRSLGLTISDGSAADPHAQPILSIGQVFGTYAIVRLLGRGGMGEVYEAEDRENGRRVALKVLSKGLANPADRARFIREGRLAASISHPNTVYVYGTEEIEGVPIITMELAPGGTLKDAVKAAGHMPPARAVDTILQVIAGLEAAADAGVLHRDIKPSNCFVDSDGTIKVGDFGLSISTQTFDERSLTMLGTVLGTPGFASPEQLRGDDLDVRADIYSVGATLYYLVTGRAPFEDGNIIRLVTQVAQEMPPSPRVARPDVPKELANVVMRCLAKRPTDRFETYEALRHALAPFSSSAPLPAPLGLRTIAGLVDYIIISIVSTLIAMQFWDSLTPGQTEGMLPGTLAGWTAIIAYYALTEGLWGRSVGKQLFGIRVVDTANQLAGIRRGAIRATVWVAGSGLPSLAAAFVVIPLMPRYQNSPLAALLSLAMILVSVLAVAAMFATARRSNGFSAIQDLVSGTRVVLKRRAMDRRRAMTPAAASLPVARRERIGPYVVLDEQPLGDSQIVSAYDDSLRRKVWIRRAQPGEPGIPPHRRTLTRPTRLRWLGGRRTATEAWDAYEAPEGQPLAALTPSANSWIDVRGWLIDLATEIRAAETERDMPPLIVDRVWITPTGRARLLEWNASAGDASSALAPQAFLYEVARRGLGGPPAEASIAVPVPLPARTLLDGLKRGSFATIDAVLADASALADQAATVTAGRRAAHLLVNILPTAVMTALLTAAVAAFVWMQISDTTRADLMESLGRLEALTRNPQRARPGEARAFEIHIASTYGSIINDRATWSEGFSLLRFMPQLEPLAKRAVEAHPSPSAAERAEAAKIVEPFLANERHKTAQMLSFRRMTSALLTIIAWESIFAAALGVLSALVVRGGVMLRLFGIAVATRTGEATRVRALWRTVIAWSPAILAIVAVVMITRSGTRSVPWMIVEGLSLALFLVGAGYAARHPERGLQDRLAGTWLVPR